MVLCAGIEGVCGIVCWHRGSVWHCVLDWHVIACNLIEVVCVCVSLKLRLEKERKEKLRQKEKDRKLRRKLEGKPVTRKEKEAESRRQAQLAALEEQGMGVWVE